MEECENGNGVSLTQEQIMEIVEVKAIKANKIYIEQLKQTLNFIEEMDKNPDKDRLTYANIINHLIGILIGSIQGWQKWCNINSMDTLLSLDEMKNIVPKMRRLVEEWIEIDISITKTKTSDIEKKQEIKKREKKKVQERKSSYVT